MIIVQLIGGLGNQLFQYAMGRNLALRMNQVVQFDGSGLGGSGPDQKDTPRAFALDGCNAVLALAEPRVCEKLKYANASRMKRLWHACRGRPRPFGPSCYRERGMHFDVAISQLRGDKYLAGYWQSHRYFEGCAEQLRKELTPRGQLSPSILDYERMIKARTAVSVHVRRGDYVSNPAANAFHGTCSPDYYREAMEVMQRQVDDPHYFVFSDDFNWAKTHLAFMRPVTFVDCPDRTHDFEEIHLMRSCRHNIIANSSFSWWGAWLNDHPARVVVAPKRWFRDPSIDTRDLIPADWCRA